MKIDALLYGVPRAPAALDALRSRVHDLRHHVAPLGLEVVTVRHHGYLLRSWPVEAAGTVSGASGVGASR